jgi:hypothetical protein
VCAATTEATCRLKSPLPDGVNASVTQSPQTCAETSTNGSAVIARNRCHGVVAEGTSTQLCDFSEATGLTEANPSCIGAELLIGLRACAFCKTLHAVLCSVPRRVIFGCWRRRVHKYAPSIIKHAMCAHRRAPVGSDPLPPPTPPGPFRSMRRRRNFNCCANGLQ